MSDDSGMMLTPLKLSGVYGVKLERKLDKRGFLTRLWDTKSFPVDFRIVQSSLVSNPQIGTLRGLHYQSKPFSESKLIQCVSGKIYDVLVDLRMHSDTYGQYFSVELGEDCDFQGIFVPKDIAHGYLTLEPHSSLLYFMDNFYSPSNFRGLNWRDNNLDIDWPFQPSLISERDMNLPMFIHE